MNNLKSMERGTKLKINLLRRAVTIHCVICIFALLSTFSIPQVTASSVQNVIVYSIPITLTNTQSINTPSPFQQMITIDSTALIQYEATNLQNIEFFDDHGKVIPSWLESGNSNTSTNTVYWLKLAGGIPASSSITVFMGFASPDTNLLNNNTTGEAPEISAVYGQYDDGLNIFSVYNNFQGAAVLSDFTLSRGNVSCNNGVTLTPPVMGATYLQTVSTYKIPLIVESYGKANSLNSYPGVEYNSSEDQFYGVGNNARCYTLTPPETLTGVFSYNTYYVFGLAVTPSSITGYSNYTQIATLPTSPAAAGSVGLAFGTYPGQDYSFFYWLRTRSNPPNGVMPSASYGIVSSTQIIVSSATASTQGAIVSSQTTKTFSTQGAIVSLLALPLCDRIQSNFGVRVYSLI